MKLIARNLSVFAIFLMSAATFAAVSSYPIQIHDRPTALPQGVFQGTMNFKLNKIDDFKQSVLSFGASVGVLDNLQIDLDYDGFKVGQKFAPNTKVRLGAKASLFSVGNWYNSINVQVPFQFKKDQRLLESISLGSSNVYLFTDKLLMLALHDNFLEMKYLKNPETNKDVARIEVNLPVAVGYQFTDNVWAQASTNLGNIKAMQMKKSKFIWDYTPLDLGLVYSFNNAIDVGINAGFNDVQDFKNTFNASLQVAYRGGNLV